MTRYKCNVCGEKFHRIQITMECHKCYIKGCKIELDKQRKEFLEVIEKLKEYFNSDRQIEKINKIIGEFK